uniref:U6 snRNA-associated Sm-like protein LSm1 n=1 Tax=Oryza meridionalis TaxID=40149 RepID=A0A0E0DET9_9ORYZ
MSSWAGPDEIFLSTSLAGFLDKKLIVLLRDGRKLLGTLCSFDQFANVVLQGACERVIVGELYCDVPLGLYVIRGENVVLIGELDREKDELPAHMTCVSEAEIRKAEKAEREARDLKGSMRKRMERGQEARAALSLSSWALKKATCNLVEVVVWV